ncbi:MAG: 4Fe-4S binding protein [Anaerolineae bacterium]|nr:4Fe-4S binding protein [Anaerolineae bacterium]
MQTPHTQFRKQYLQIPIAIMVILWALAFIYWQRGGEVLSALLLAYIGLFVGAGIGLYIAFPPLQRPKARRLVMLMVGGLLLVIALVSDHGNMQIEGLFFGVLTGVAPYIILHYALAKIVGPLVFGRIWCGWACWFAMVLDLLPYPYSRYRIPGRWGWLRYAHFGVSLVIVLTVWFGYHISGAIGDSGLAWFVIGLLLYYAIGIGMAFALKDNRAFCKYLCPISVLLKTTSRFSLLKIGGVPTSCDECQACVELCPMNIRVRDYILSGQRVLSTECTLCQICINVCPDNTLKLTFGLDIGGQEHIDYEPPRSRVRRRS